MKSPATLTRIQKCVEAMGFETIVSPAKSSFSLVGYRVDIRVGFQAFWIDGKWSHAKAADPVGVPQELWGNYAPKSIGSKRPSQAQVENGKRMDAEYNTGASWLNHRPWFKSANDFYQWIDDWQGILLAGKPYKKLARQVKPKQPIQQELEGSEWSE